MATSKNKNTVVLDSIYGIINTDPGIRKIIDTPAVQRLRGIKQTGLLHLVYHSAVHNRFSHALGAFEVSRKVMNALKEKGLDFGQSVITKFSENEKAFYVAALCHDIGHSPFSHALEKELLPNGLRDHEECTKYLIRNCEPLAKAIKEYCDHELVYNFLAKSDFNTYLCDLISGPLDVDRLDYLSRDSQATGLPYGNVDLNWLIHSLNIRNDQKQRPNLVIEAPKGLVALEQFFRSRINMYDRGYFHKTVQGGETLLKTIITRAFFLAKNNHNGKDIALAPFPLNEILKTSQVSLENFLFLQDCHVWVAILTWAVKAKDGILKMLCQQLANRTLPLAMFATAKFVDLPDNERTEKISKIKSEIAPILIKHLKTKGLKINEEDCDFFFWFSLKTLSLGNMGDRLFLSQNDTTISLTKYLENEDQKKISKPINLKFGRFYIFKEAYDEIFSLLKNEGLITDES